MTKDEFLSLKVGEIVEYCGKPYPVFAIHKRQSQRSWRVILYQYCGRRKKRFHNMQVDYRAVNLIPNVSEI